MHLTREMKQEMIEELTAIAKNSSSAVAAEYIGLTVAQMTELRRSAREAGVSLRVVRNTLARRALADTRFAPMTERLKGPLLLGFSSEEPGAVAKVVRDFMKENERLVPKMIMLEDQLLEPDQLKSVAELPSLQDARATLLGLLQAPQSRLLRLLSEVPASLLRAAQARAGQSAGQPE